MFSVEGGSARSSLRSTRRRPRASDGPQQGRRKRSKLGDDTFVAVADAHTHGNGNGSLVMNGHAPGTAESSLVTVDVPVREKNSAPVRASKDDSALYLNKNDSYTVKRFPGFPAALANAPAPFRASALTSAGLALALTADQALIWDYSGAPASTKLISISLPPTLKGADPLPLGAIVRNGPANDFGLVAVAPATGRIVFWENVESAQARGHFAARHQGLEGSIKLQSGERITELVDIDHAGYIIVFSSGRLAQMTLRDAQGRPSIVTIFMSAPNGSGGSFLSSFSGFLGVTNRKTIASVKARPSGSKGQMEVVTGTRNGVFEVWDLSWTGQQMFKREFNAHEDILAALQPGTAPEIRELQESHILDFAIMDQQTTRGSLSLLALVVLSGRNSIDYFLLELDLSENATQVSRSIPLRNFHQAELPKEATGTLLLPNPGQTAFVQFPTAIVVASVVQPEESPQMQLITDSGGSLLPFQDSIYFNANANVRVVGHALEHVGRKDKQPSVLIFVEDYGILQISTCPPPENNPQPYKEKVTAYDKILQATLFDSVPGTILDFSTRSRYNFAQAEVESAALSISHSVLSTEPHLIEKAKLSMEELFIKRVDYLRALCQHVRSEYPPLSFSGRWQLMLHAEKLAAARSLWNWYQAKLRDRELNPDAYPEKNIMCEIVDAMPYGMISPPNASEADPVRQFFIRNIVNIGVLIPLGWSHLRSAYIKNEAKNRPAIMQCLSEINDTFLVTLEVAYNFRQNNIEHYGLDPDSVWEGVLKTGRGGDSLRVIWTASHNIVTALRSLVDVGRSLAEESFEEHEAEDLSKKIAQDNPRLVRMVCQTHIERYRMALEQNDEKMKELGRKIRDEWNFVVRPAHILGLMKLGMTADGMNLAEKYGDMPTLVSLIWEETKWLEEGKENCTSKIELAEISVKLNRMKERVARYFKAYGNKFADEYFAKHIAANRSGLLLETEFPCDKLMLTMFLCEPARSKLYWIERVTDNDFNLAGVGLFNAAHEHEGNSWCQKVELSISKLSLMCKDQVELGTPEQQAAEEPNRHRKAIPAPKIEKVLNKVKNSLAVSKVLDEMHDLLLPTVTRALDDESAVTLLVDEFGEGRLKERPALQALLRQGFDDLIHHHVMDPARMIDVLTLMLYNSDGPESTSPVQSNEDGYAFRTLALGWDDIQRNTRIGLKGLIWKRLFIKDDWAQINKAKDVSNVSDESLNEFLVLKTRLGWTMKFLVEATNHDPRFKNVWFQSLDELVGKGCTDGDLCIRFPSEDIRQPIIRENALDEADFHRYVETANLEKWYAASVRAAKWMLQREKKVDWSLPPVPEGEVRGAVRAVEEKEAEGGEEVVQESMEVEDERIAESRDMEMVEA